MFYHNMKNHMCPQFSIMIWYAILVHAEPYEENDFLIIYEKYTSLDINDISFPARSFIVKK